MEKQKPDKLENELPDVEKRAHQKEHRDDKINGDANARKQEAAVEEAFAKKPSD